MNARRRPLTLGCAVAALVAVLVTPPAAACACGGMAPPAGIDVSVATERAVVWRSGGQELIELSLGLQTESVETGLIFPTPAPAQVSLGDSATFDKIEEAIAPRTIVDDDWWGFADTATGGAGAPPGAAAGGPPPEVLGQVLLGPVQATTLRATDASGLNDWLDQNGFEIRDTVQGLLSLYVDRGWYFVAVKLSSDTALAGGLDPIRFSFDSAQLVYPLELSRAATEPQLIRLYVFDENRTKVGAAATPSQEIKFTTTNWAGHAPDSFGDRGSYLTVHDLAFYQPATEIPGDLEFTQAATNDAVNADFHVMRLVMWLGMPLGWALLWTVILALILIGIASHYIGRARRRRLYHS